MHVPFLKAFFLEIIDPIKYDKGIISHFFIYFLERFLMNMPRSSMDSKAWSALQGRYIKSMIYGGIDGVVTTFAVVAGGSGASLTSNVLLVLGLANLIADGFSMGFGDFISSKAENEFRKKETLYEHWMMEKHPAQIKDQVKNIYIKRGFQANDAEALAALISNNKDMVVSMFLAERGIFKVATSPIAKSLYTFFSFIFFGAIPLLTYLLVPYFPLARDHNFATACVLTGITLFVLGTIKVTFTGRNWILSGLEMVLLGGVSAFMAYLVGVMLGHLI